jgi:hypothetical protein
VSLQFGQLKKLSLRDIWSREATDFTPWLAENIRELGKALGLDLELESREAGVGDFSLDLLAKDLGSGRTVVIENQLERTDHDHLGKLLTYAAGFNASLIVWVADTIREEHRQALEWLNQRTGTDTEFFGVVVEVLRIDDSKPAFNFKPVVFPNEWQKTKTRAAAAAAAPSSRGEAYRSFFQRLIDELREKHKFTNARAGQPQNWYSFASGAINGVNYNTFFAEGGRAVASVLIDVRRDWEETRRLFDWLRQDQAAIESEFGAQLTWSKTDDVRACSIRVDRPGSIEDDAATLQDIHSWLVANLLRLKKVFGPRLRAYSAAKASQSPPTPSQQNSSRTE